MFYQPIEGEDRRKSSKKKKNHTNLLAQVAKMLAYGARCQRRNGICFLLDLILIIKKYEAMILLSCSRIESIKLGEKEFCSK